MKEEMTRAFTESAKGIAWREEQLLIVERARQYSERMLERQRVENVRAENVRAENVQREERNRLRTADLRTAEERLERARERLERARQGQPVSIGAAGRRDLALAAGGAPAAGGGPARASMPAPAIDPTLNHSLTQLTAWVTRVRRDVNAAVAIPRAPKSLSLKMVPSFENYTVEEECCICYDAEPIVGLPCKHTFCATCTSTTAKTRCICPMCRAEFSEIHIAQDIHPEQFNKVVAKIIIM